MTAKKLTVALLAVNKKLKKLGDGYTAEMQNFVTDQINWFSSLNPKRKILMEIYGQAFLNIMRNYAPEKNITAKIICEELGE